MTTTPEQIADLTKAHTDAHQDLLKFVDSLQTRVNQMETALENKISLAAPAGSVIAYAAKEPPQGWLECNGKLLLRNDYADLFAVIGTTYGEGDKSTTFNLPDLRGEFVRGWDNERGIDKSRNIGSYQPGTKIAGEGGASDSRNNHTINDINQVFGDPIYETNFDTNVQYNSNTAEMRVSNNAVWWRTVRPRNLALMYCIKF